MSFVQRLINLTVQLAPNTQTNQPVTFQESGTDTATVSGLRTSVRIVNSGAPVDCRATVRVWGLTPSLMNQLTTLGLVFNLVPKNQLTIQAGDSQSGMTTIFSGTIYYAYADYASQPDVPFTFECISGAGVAVQSTPPTSFAGSSDVATVMSGLARQMNIGFQNNGVTKKIWNVYLSGSLTQQVEQLRRWADISCGYVNGGNTLAIWPKGGNCNTPNVPIISPLPTDNSPGGMVSYPAFTQQGIRVKTLFNPLLSFGSLVQVESSILTAIAAVQAQRQSGASTQSSSTFPSQWAINKLDLALDSKLPRGEWASTIWAYNPGYSNAIIAPGA